MKKPSKCRQNYLREKRSKKKLKRMQLKRKYKDPLALPKKINDFRFIVDKRIINNSVFRFNDFLEVCGFYAPPTSKSYIKIPNTFSLLENYQESVDVTQLTLATIIKYPGKEITIDFSSCNKADYSALFLLKVFLEEATLYWKGLQRKLFIADVIPKIKINGSKHDYTNILLLTAQLVRQAEAKVDSTAIPVSSKGIVKGEKFVKHYLKNKKGVEATETVKYINNCLKQHLYMLTPTGINNLNGIVAEVLNNAEDHGLSGEWYTDACFLHRTKNDSTVVGELHLAFLNFGYSFYEGFVKSKDLNQSVYKEMQNLYEHVIANSGADFSQENLFTLYALQDGFSRLKYEDISRGTGTMKFINSFLEFGGHTDQSMQFFPYMMILSGSTRIRCDSDNKPFMIKNNFYMSLNSSRNLTEPPSKNNLQTLPSHFPGTMLSLKLYLNSDHLNKTYQNVNARN